MAGEQQQDEGGRRPDSPVAVSEVYYGGTPDAVVSTTATSRREATYRDAGGERPSEAPRHHRHHHAPQDGNDPQGDAADAAASPAASPEGEPHHHHHHHSSSAGETSWEASSSRRSSSSSTDGSGLATSSSSGSGRHRRSRRSSSSSEPRETHNVIFPTLGMSPITVALMGAVIAFIILAPVIAILVLREHAMQRKLLSAQTSLGLAMTENEKLAAARDKALVELKEARAMLAQSPAASAVAAASPEAIPEINIDGLLSGEADTNAAPSAVAEPPKSPAEQLGVSEAEVGEILRAAELLPNGNRYVSDATGKPAQHADAFRSQIDEAYAALAASSNAVEAFEAIVEKLPRWPYGHLYLALAKGDINELTNAVPRFEAARVVKPDLAEAAIYRAMLALFQADNRTADAELDALPIRSEDDPNPLALGPLYVPYYAPERLKLKFARRAGLPSVKEVDWVQR